MTEPRITNLIMCQNEEKLASLFSALSAAQAGYERIEKKSTGAILHGRKLKFANLGQIDDAVRAPLADHGLAILYPPGLLLEPNKRIMRGLLVHAEGGWVLGEMEVDTTPQEGDVKAKLHAEQSAGKAMSYARRNMFAYMSGAILIDEGADLDEGVPSGKSEEKPPAPAAPAPAAPTPAAPQAAEEAPAAQEAPPAPAEDGKPEQIGGAVKAAYREAAAAYQKASGGGDLMSLDEYTAYREGLVSLSKQAADRPTFDAITQRLCDGKVLEQLIIITDKAEAKKLYAAVNKHFNPDME